MQTVNIGSYGAGELIVDQFYSNRGNKLTIFFHGCCGTVFENEPTTYQVLSKGLTTEKVTSCAIFESSRNMRKIDISPEMEFLDFATKAFGGKTFTNELEDARAAVDYIKKSYVEQTKQEPELYFVGFSMGGLIATILSAEFDTKSIMAFGSASRFSVMDGLPIIGTTEQQDEVEFKVKDIAAGLQIPVMIVRGSDDDTASREQAQKLFNFFEGSSIKYLGEWKGVDHRFKLRNGIPDNSLTTEMTVAIRNFIELPSPSAS